MESGLGPRSSVADDGEGVAECLEPSCRRRQLEAIQRLAGGVAHDFNNRLAEILGNAELALSNKEMSHDLRDAFESIVDSARRSAVTVRQLLAFARQETISPQTLDLNQAIDDLLKLRAELVDEKVRLTWDPCPTTPLVRADPKQIQQILEQLLHNAQDAVLSQDGPVAPEIRISTGRRVVDEETSRRYISVLPGVFARIEVANNGRGLDERQAAMIFDPFFSTKEGGLKGLGLAAVEGIAGQNGGFVEVASRPGGGCSFQVALPSQPSAAEAPNGRGDKGGAAEHDGDALTVLVVDDEPALLRLCKRRLGRMGYHVLDAPGARQALDLVRSYPGRIDLVLSDVMMPEMNGRELSLALQELRPSLPTLFMSGYAAEVLAGSGVLPPGVHFLSKPFSDEELLAKLAELARGA